MMIITLLGFDVVDYDSKSTKKHVHGVRIYGSQDREVDNTHIGQSVFTAFMSRVNELELVEGGRYEVLMEVSEDRQNPGRYNARPAGLRQIEQVKK